MEAKEFTQQYPMHALCIGSKYTSNFIDMSVIYR
jgi:hypothetical protein